MAGQPIFPKFLLKSESSKEYNFQCLKIYLQKCDSFQPQQDFAQVRFAGARYIDIEQIRDRVMLVLKLYDKINPETVSLNG